MTQDISAFIPQVLAQSIMILRQNAIMPKLVNRDYSTEIASRGTAVTIPLPSPATVRNVAASYINPGPTDDLAPKTTQVYLNNWIESSFVLSDKDLTSIQGGSVPRQVQEAAKSLSNKLDQDLLSLYRQVYNFAGTPGTTPFSAANTLDAQNCYRILNSNLAPNDERYLVVDPFAQANMLSIPALQYLAYSGSSDALREGNTGKVLGFDVNLDQNVLTHQAGTASGYKVATTSMAVGSNTVSVGSGTGNFVFGDIFTVSGDPQTYTVMGWDGAGTINFAPAAKQAWAVNSSISSKSSHVVNMAFHRDAFAMVSRPLDSVYPGGSLIQSLADPISGVTMRLEVSRQYKTTSWSLDILYGVAAIRPELAVRLAG